MSSERDRDIFPFQGLEPLPGEIYRCFISCSIKRNGSIQKQSGSKERSRFVSYSYYQTKIFVPPKPY